MFVLVGESGGFNGERMTRITTKLRTGNSQGDPLLLLVVRKYRTRGKTLTIYPHRRPHRGKMFGSRSSNRIPGFYLYLKYAPKYRVLLAKVGTRTLALTNLVTEFPCSIKVPFRDFLQEERRLNLLRFFQFSFRARSEIG